MADALEFDGKRGKGNYHVSGVNSSHRERSFIEQANYEQLAEIYDELAKTSEALDDYGNARYYIEYAGICRHG
jgi:hypothetical protein